mmetsp:Transcript_1351/g.3799  ORF Transcript_1351/g.3799 Transcript_1351/m.3799 type:complete len:221 (+) Transcript_1351:460-1122(+)
MRQKWTDYSRSSFNFFFLLISHSVACTLWAKPHLFYNVFHLHGVCGVRGQGDPALLPWSPVALVPAAASSRHLDATSAAGSVPPWLCAWLTRPKSSRMAERTDESSSMAWAFSAASAGLMRPTSSGTTCLLAHTFGSAKCLIFFSTCLFTIVATALPRIPGRCMSSPRMPPALPLKTLSSKVGRTQSIGTPKYASSAVFVPTVVMARSLLRYSAYGGSRP